MTAGPPNPEPPARPRRGVRARAAVVLAAVPVGVAVMLWFHQPAGKPPPAHPAMAPTPNVAVAAAAPPAAASTPAPAADVAVAAPVLPASNAFTTLEDYRQRRAAIPQTPPPAVTPPAGRTPETELGRVTFMVRDYRAAFGSNPVGSNREITRALLGDNPGATKFVDPSTVALSARGELLDAWGHPYFFHAMSGKLMEIRSAGPDGKIFTADDLVR